MFPSIPDQKNNIAPLQLKNIPDPKILFIVSLFNNEEFIQESLSAIISQRGAWQKKILVINDGSRDQSVLKVQELARRYPEIQILQQKHQSQAAALNFGLKKAQGYDFVALVEADVKIEREWLQKNLPVFQRPVIMGVGGSLQPFRKDKWIARLAGSEIEYKLAHQPRCPIHLTSANVLYRASIFRKIGQFRADLKNSSFDIEFNSRVIRVGGRLVYNPGAKAWHHYKPTLSAFLKRSYAYARFRPYLKGITPYPYDYIIKLQIVLAFLIPVILLFAVIFNDPLLFFGCFLFAVLYLLSTLPPMIWTLRRKNDRVMLLYPAISILRNNVALLGLGVGVLKYWQTSGRKK
ncbi:MAG: glycosyltransferase [Patescibacteria group bacterium]|nr:glycosyltransferase [Patescibacteria group bacterium]